MKKIALLSIAVMLSTIGLVSGCNNPTVNNSSSNGNINKVLEGDKVIDLQIKKMPNKLQYKSGERFNPSGLIFDVVYQNGYDEDINLDYGDLDGWTPNGALTSKDTKVTLLFEGFKKDIDITVEEKAIQEVEITREPDIKSYSVGDTLDLSGLTVKATYEEGVVENEKDYTITDSEGNVYENGTVLDQRNSSLELFVTISGQGITKKDSFIIGVYGGISIQAENHNDELDLTNSDGYAETSGKFNESSAGTHSGPGYLENIDIGFEIKYYVYSKKALEGADLILGAASTCVSATGVREDMQFNKVFSVTIGEEAEPLSIPDETVIPGGGSSWRDWREVNLGKVSLKEGYNLITFKCIGKIKDTTPNNPYDRAPNIDYIKVKKDNEELLVEAESKKGVSLNDIKTSFTRLSSKSNIKKDCTFTGTGYIGSITKGFKIDFYIYSEEEILSADLALIASSTYVGDGRMLDMQFNECFSVTSDGNNVEIPNETVIPGLEFPSAESGGNKWTNWTDVNLGKIKLNKGFTVVSLTCIGSVKDSSNNDRTPNIDRLDIRF